MLYTNYIMSQEDRDELNIILNQINDLKLQIKELEHKRDIILKGSMIYKKEINQMLDILNNRR